MLPLSPETPQISNLPSSFLGNPETNCIVRQRTPITLEVWGSDIGKHFLLRYDERQEHFLDVIDLSRNDDERGYGVG
jgi:hypothetical protein